MPYAQWYLCVNRKGGKHKERHRKKEDTETNADFQQPHVERESSDIVEDAEPDEEENIYVSDQEEEKRRLCDLAAELSKPSLGG